MIPQQSSDRGEFDDDYFVRLLAFMLRHRVFCLSVVLMSSLISVVLHQSSLPYRTVMCVRLVSPCVAYKHREYWELSSRAWRSQLNAAASRHQSSELQISSTVGEEPWLLVLTAEYAQHDQIEGLLRDLVHEVEHQLGVNRFDTSDVDGSIAGKPKSFAGSSALMLELRQKLMKIERALDANDVVQHDLGLAGEKTAVHVSGTWSPVPIQSVPYFPWFDRLQARVCEELSVSATTKNGDQLINERKEMAEDLEQASILITQVWFSLDPLNPVNELPHARIQSIYSGRNHRESIVRTAVLGCWFGAVATAVVAAVGMWYSTNASKILGLSGSMRSL